MARGVRGGLLVRRGHGPGRPRRGYRAAAAWVPGGRGEPFLGGVGTVQPGESGGVARGHRTFTEQTGLGFAG